MAVEDVFPADRMSRPGARRSTQLPPLEKLVMLSSAAVAPTAMTDGSRAGLNVHASAAKTPVISQTLRPHLPQLVALPHTGEDIRGIT